ncbi:restriction endonuclease [Jiella endophytica]|uniref:restriction endonuclease n=1 Tax=Jiella endophytica TaxID=2558362 RepID=UPI001FE0B093|nr:restriction endonuclease [Jiella endophytica]
MTGMQTPFRERTRAYPSDFPRLQALVQGTVEALAEPGRLLGRPRLSRRHGRPRRQGLIITTSTFTKDARAEATRDGAPAIDLVDGVELCRLSKETRIVVVVSMVEKVSIEEGVFSTIGSTRPTPASGPP